MDKLQGVLDKYLGVHGKYPEYVILPDAVFSELKIRVQSMLLEVGGESLPEEYIEYRGVKCYRESSGLRYE